MGGVPVPGRLQLTQDGQGGNPKGSLRRALSRGVAERMDARPLTRVDAKALWQIGEWQALGAK